MDFIVELKKTHIEIAATIEKYISAYILYYCRSLSHRLLKTPINEHAGMTVSVFINNCTRYNNVLANNNIELQINQFNIRLAKIIDSNATFRKLYLLTRKVYKKPIYK